MAISRMGITIVFFLTAILWGCETTPETPRQALAAAEISFTEIVLQISEGRRAGLIGDDTYADMREIIDVAHKAIREARIQVAMGADATALARVTSVTSALHIALQEELNHD